MPTHGQDGTGQDGGSKLGVSGIQRLRNVLLSFTAHSHVCPPRIFLNKELELLSVQEEILEKKLLVQEGKMRKNRRRKDERSVLC